MSQMLFAQIDTISVEVYQSYRPELADAYKLSANPQMPQETQQKRPKLNYSVLNRKIPTTFSAPEIQPLKVKKERPPELDNFYLKAGFGNFTTPLLNVHYMNKANDDFEFGGNFSHISSRGNISVDTINFEKANFSNTDLNLFGKYFLASNTVYGGIDFSHLGRQLYGYNPEDTSFSEKELDRNYTRIKINGGIRSKENDLDNFNYDANFHYTNFSQNFTRTDPKENNFRFSANFFKKLNNHRFDIFTSYDFTSYAPNDTFSLNRNLLYINPKFTLILDKIYADIGFNSTLETIATNDSTKFHIFPNVKVSFLIDDKYFIAYAGVRGELQRTSFETLVERNPFLQTDALDIRNTAKKFEVFGGVKGSLGDKTNYNAEVAYNNSDNALFFQNNPIDPRQILPVYFDNTNIFDIKAEIEFQAKKKFNARLKANYRIFSNSDTLFQAWMQPKLTTNLALAYRPIEKLKFEANLFNYAGIDYLANDGTTQTLDPIFDISLGAEFQVSKQFSIFANVNNLTSVNYLRWFNYPSYGLNAIGGITLSL